ncbi:MAG: YbaB/EbfC family nucleoid-associated protein [Anaerolineae bacterium]|nr:YbaB/EbfC family nucleoid-associated protein [Anaerolineae bacterium]NUQ06444.1 YbaB/EbfC family nucleoid-associated protein [Anaerolineae bacterium]
MSKRRGGLTGGIPGGLGGGNAGLMRQLQKMQEDMVTAQEALANETVEVNKNGVTVVITGHQRVQSIAIDTSKIDTSDEEWATDLQDLLVIAVNQAIEESQTMAAQRMEAITGGLSGMPGLGGLL